MENAKSSLKAEDYERFYEQNFHDSNKPLLYLHTKSEGKLEYNSLFFIPQNAPFDLFRVDYQSGLKLYVKRVFISDDDKELYQLICVLCGDYRCRRFTT